MAIIRSGNRAQAAAMIQGGVNMDTVNWLRQSNQAMASSGASGKLHDMIMQSSALWISDKAIQDTNNLMRRYSVAMDLDVLRPLATLEEFQAAKPYMRKYMMANPTLKQSWLNGEADGYDGDFEQFEVGAVGEADRHWRTVMNGMEVEEDKTYSYTTYCDADDMNANDQLDIQDMWQHVNYIMEVEEDDPSSILGNSL